MLGRSFIFAATGVSLVFSAGTALAQDASAPAPKVVYAEVEKKDLKRTTSFTGRVVSLRKIDVRARVTGFVENIPFTEGDLVKEGDLLYSIEDDAYIAAVGQIDGTIGAAEAELRLAQIEVDRKTVLVKRNAVAQSELDVATAQHDKIAAQIIGMKANKDDAELNLSYTKISAPFDGIVGLSVPDKGALVGPESGPLTTLTMLDPISVEFPIATAIFLDYEEKKAAGAEPDVQLTLPNGKTYDKKGSIDFVSSTVSAGTDTVLVRAEFANPDSVLLDSALVGVTLEAAEADHVLAIPVQAIQRDQQGFFVLTVSDDNKANRQPVVVDRTTNGEAVIASGLKEGDKVITEGVNKVRAGMPVDAELAKSAPAKGN